MSKAAERSIVIPNTHWVFHSHHPRYLLPCLVARPRPSEINEMPSKANISLRAANVCSPLVIAAGRFQDALEFTLDGDGMQRPWESRWTRGDVPCHPRLHAGR